MAGDDKTEDTSVLDYGDVIDAATFEQILEMDDDPADRDFSKPLVLEFFEQAATTFEGMDQALEAKDLQQLSDQGHFLKGSSATLGLIKVKDGCEKIQHWGLLKDEHGDNPLDEKTCLKNIKEILPTVMRNCAEAEKRLRIFYGEN